MSHHRPAAPPRPAALPTLAFVGLLATTALAGVARPAAAQSLTTTFDGSNNQVGTMFDLTALGSTILLTRLDLNVFRLNETPATLNVWLTPGTYAGKEGTPAAWTLAQTVTLNSAQPTGTATPVSFATPITLVGGQSYGLYVMFAGQSNSGGANILQYTTGSSTYADANLRFTSGIGVGGTFGPTFSPRTFNGTFYYSVATVPEPSTWALVGGGMVGLAGVAARRRRTPSA